MTQTTKMDIEEKQAAQACKHGNALHQDCFKCDYEKENKPKLLIVVYPDLRRLHTGRLGLKVAAALAEGYDVEVRVGDDKIQGTCADGIFIDEAEHV